MEEVNKLNANIDNNKRDLYEQIVINAINVYLDPEVTKKQHHILNLYNDQLSEKIQAQTVVGTVISYIWREKHLMSTEDLQTFICEKLEKQFRFKKLKHKPLITSVVDVFLRISEDDEANVVERCAHHLISLLIHERDETWQTILEMFHHTGIDSFLKLILGDDPITTSNKNLFVHQFRVALSLLRNRTHLLGIFRNSEYKLECRIQEIEPKMAVFKDFEKQVRHPLIKN